MNGFPFLGCYGSESKTTLYLLLLTGSINFNIYSKSEVINGDNSKKNYDPPSFNYTQK